LASVNDAPRRSTPERSKPASAAPSRFARRNLMSLAVARHWFQDSAPHLSASRAARFSGPPFAAGGRSLQRGYRQLSCRLFLGGLFWRGHQRLYWPFLRGAICFSPSLGFRRDPDGFNIGAIPDPKAPQQGKRESRCYVIMLQRRRHGGNSE